MSQEIYLKLYYFIPTVFPPGNSGLRMFYSLCTDLNCFQFIKANFSLSVNNL